MWKMFIERSNRSNLYSLFIVTDLIMDVMFMASQDTYNIDDATTK